MKSYLFSVLPFLLFIPFFQKDESKKADPSPLAVFSSEWNDAKYLKCNTAADSRYLSEDERKLICILNLLHTDPKLFANTVVAKYPEYMNKSYLKNVREYQSLLDTLRKVRTLPLLYPDSLCFESATCQAVYAGKTAYVGHERKTDECKTKKHYQGECCQYGYKDPLSVVMAFLIDLGSPSSGHRFLCLSDYGHIGVSIQPHTDYGDNTVIDFYY